MIREYVTYLYIGMLATSPIVVMVGLGYAVRYSWRYYTNKSVQEDMQAELKAKGQPWWLVLMSVWVGILQCLHFYVKYTG